MIGVQPRDNELFACCKNFLQAAVKVLAEHTKTAEHIPQITYYKPILKEEGVSYSYLPYQEPNFSYLIVNNIKKIRSLPETKQAFNYVKEKKYLDIGKSHFDPFTLLEQALQDYLKKKDPLKYDEEEFLDIYTKIEDLIFNDEISFRCTAKLKNFSCSNDLIELDSFHFIRKYTPNECKELYHHPSINIYDHNLPKPGDHRIEVLTTKNKSDWGQAGIEGTNEAKKVLTVLRLFKDSAVGISTLENEPITWFPFTGKSSALLPPHQIGMKCSIEEHEIPELIALWKTIENIDYTNVPPLGIAIKRFNYSHEHKDREDALVDMIIALEALYLDTQNELRFRLALRVATFLEASLPTYRREKKAVFDNVSEAYNLRSKVVHGSKIPSAKIHGYEIVKTYLSDSVKQFARISPKHGWKDVLNKIDESIKSNSRENLKALFS